MITGFTSDLSIKEILCLDVYKRQEVGGYIDNLLNERLLGVLSTKENVNLQTLGFEDEQISRYMAIISPIDIAGERLGTLFMYRSAKMCIRDSSLPPDFSMESRMRQHRFTITIPTKRDILIWDMQKKREKAGSIASPRGISSCWVKRLRL